MEVNFHPSSLLKLDEGVREHFLRVKNISGTYTNMLEHVRNNFGENNFFIIF